MKKIKISKAQWVQIGKIAKWLPSDPLEFTDRDTSAIYDPETEENVILGEEEETSMKQIYEEGYSAYEKWVEESVYPMNPYNTESGKQKHDMWNNGFTDAQRGVRTNS